MAETIERSWIGVMFDPYDRSYLFVVRKHDVALKGRYKIVRVQNLLLAYDKSTDPIWQLKLTPEVEWLGIISGSKNVIAVGRTKNGGLRTRLFSYTDGEETKTQNGDDVKDKFIVKE